MLALNGYYDGLNIIPIDKISGVKKNQRVIIAFLDEKIEPDEELVCKLKHIDELAGSLNDVAPDLLEEFDKIISERVNITREATLNE